MNKHNNPSRIARWVLRFEEYDFEVEHPAGNHMQYVDALSRQPVVFNEQEEQQVMHVEIDEKDG